jgi:AraC-like DNA-binding protein
LTPTPTLKLRAARSIALEVGYTSPSQFAQVFRPALRRAITGGSVEKRECTEVL